MLLEHPTCLPQEMQRGPYPCEGEHPRRPLARRGDMATCAGGPGVARPPTQSQPGGVELFKAQSTASHVPFTTV